MLSTFLWSIATNRGHFRVPKLDFDVEIYDLACGLIIKQINQ